ncbi:hypothetical protein [Ralstonia mannitolilytica]|uniref:hypothetical protein n=1 Tax=Ralstonia mannitolilytica TaxID=105219 RepID=UPI001F0ABDF1|nr:hypothetical protein [Ralstonia mannitolilytica]
MANNFPIDRWQIVNNITASIVLYNNSVDQIHQCVKSLQADLRVHVLLVDNSEKKGGYASLAGKHVEILDAPGNVGFGRGHNVVLDRLEQVGSAIHLVVNPDIVVKPGCVRGSMSFRVESNTVTGASPARTGWPAGA